MTLDLRGIKNLCKLADDAYEELRNALMDGGQLPLVAHQLALFAARSRSLYVLIRDLLAKGCGNETRILVRPLIEDTIGIMWICDAEAAGSIEERLFAIQFEGRLAAYGSKFDISLSKLGKLREKDQLHLESWWGQLVADLTGNAASLAVAFAQTKAAKDVLKVPNRFTVYDSYAAKGYDLRALDKVYVDTCSATHRDGHDLNRYWMPHPEGGGHILVSSPYGQPEHWEGGRFTLLLVSSLTFLTSLSAIRTHLGIRTETDATLDRLTSLLAADEGTET